MRGAQRAPVVEARARVRALRLTRGSVRGRPAREPVMKPSFARSTAALRSFPTTRPYARRHSGVSEISHLITPEGNVPRVDAHDSYVAVARGWNRHATGDPASSVRPYFNRRTSSRLSDLQPVELFRRETRMVGASGVLGVFDTEDEAWPARLDLARAQVDNNGSYLVVAIFVAAYVGAKALLQPRRCA
jgi:hypothetical protein